MLHEKIKVKKCLKVMMWMSKVMCMWTRNEYFFYHTKQNKKFRQIKKITNTRKHVLIFEI